MDVVLFGPPGAGKGTQAKRFVDLLGVPQISTGDIMRSERASGSEIGRRFDDYMSQGKLVPDELVLELLRERLSEPSAQNGAIFDGYPRTVSQGEALDALLAHVGRRIEAVISLEVPLADLVDRIVDRRTDEASGQIYHLRYNPPPVGFGGALVQRKDDTEEVVRARYEEYQTKTAPLLGYYGKKGLVKSISGVGSLDEITARIKRALGKA
jgi:adenylate kinase